MDIFFETNSHPFHGRPFFGKDTTRALPQLYIFCRPYYLYFRTKVLYESTKVLSYFQVLSYLRRITLLGTKYFRTFEGTFVLSYILRVRVQLYTTTRACTVGILYSTSFENESNRSTISYCTVCTRTLKHIKQILPSGISNMKVSCLSTFVSSKIKLLRKYENRILSYHTSI